MKLENKSVVITGAGSVRGIGRAVALRFAREGADLVVADLDGEGASRTARDILALGRGAVGVAMDVTRADHVESLVEQAVQAFGKVDVLVNNAGFCEFVPFLDISEELWDRTMAVNAKGYFLVGQAVARQMIRQGNGGRIINVSSVCAEISGEEKVHYCASKAAVKLLTQGMALELARYGINVNALAPGTVDTDIIRQENIQRLVEHERSHSSIPWGRMASADDLAGAAVFLASDDSAYMTGASVVVDGGILAGTGLPPEFRARRQTG